MALLEKKDVDFSHVDERGSLFQLVHAGYEQVNVLFTRANVRRGGHYHKRAIECFFVVSGMVEVTAWLDKRKECIIFHQNEFFQINPPAAHSMFFPVDCVLVAMYDHAVENPDGTKDIIPAGGEEV